VKKNSTNGCFRLLIYLHTNKTIHNALYVFDKWGKYLRYKKMQYNYSKKMFTRRAKPVGMIGDPDNQLPGNWSSTVFVLEQPRQNLHFSALNGLY